jgi:hypothetical protein
MYVSKIIPILFAAFLIGCQSINKESIETPSVKTTLGGLEIHYASNGDFEFLTSTATAPVTSSLPNARDEAATVATLRARRQISEFLNTNIQSESFTEIVSTSLQQSNQVANTENKDVTVKIVTNLRESIRQNSESILKGTVVESVIHDSSTNTVEVKVTTSTRLSQTSRQLNTNMR